MAEFALIVRKTLRSGVEQFARKRLVQVLTILPLVAAFLGVKFTQLHLLGCNGVVGEIAVVSLKWNKGYYRNDEVGYKDYQETG